MSLSILMTTFLCFLLTPSIPADVDLGQFDERNLWQLIQRNSYSCHLRKASSESAALIDAMLKAKFSEEEIRKVSGENAIRLLSTLLPE